MNVQLLSHEMIEKLQALISDAPIECLDDVMICDGLQTTLLYPTDDLLLSEKQFLALLKTIEPWESIFAFQTSDHGVWSVPGARVFEFSSQIDYEKYESLSFYAPVIVFGASFSWVIIIDESIEGGEGLLAGPREFVDKFRAIYQSTEHDLLKFVSFYLEDTEKRNYSTQHLKNIISKLMR